MNLVIHAKELKRATNTGALAVKALVNSEMSVRGATSTRLDLSHLCDSGYRPVLLYPSASAVELTQAYVDESDVPICLIVPDGNWRQASKVHYRHRELADVPRMSVQEKFADAGFLRTETTPGGMATLKAIASAFAILEGAVTGEALYALYRLKLQRTLEGRGQQV